jgi:hypothetical protein
MLGDRFLKRKNSFLTSLRQICTSEPGNAGFWSQVQKQGRNMSLISDKEAATHGGKSAISESKAEKASVWLNFPDAGINVPGVVSCDIATHVVAWALLVVDLCDSGSMPLDPDLLLQGYL